jgi:hypothetical protein
MAKTNYIKLTYTGNLLTMRQAIFLQKLNFEHTTFEVEVEENGWKTFWLSRFNMLHIKFLCICMISVGENNIYVHSNNRLSLDRIITGMQ